MKTPEVTVRGKAALDAELAKAERAKQQEGEDVMALLLDELGIRYIRQYPYSDIRKFRADFALFSSEVLIEIVGGIYPFKRTRKDGSEVVLPGAHGTVAGIKADCERLNEATLNGFKMLRFLPEQVRDGTARRTLERLLK